MTYVESLKWAFIIALSFMITCSTILNTFVDHSSDICDNRSNNVSVLDMKRNVAIGCAISTRGAKLNVHLKRVERRFQGQTLQEFPFFTQLLTSFCKTASTGYAYHFYIAYDYDDEYFKNETNVMEFRVAFDMRKCCHLNVHLHLVECKHSGKPAWAQNDAMMQAYIDNMEYFYRVNDDTELITANWTNIFIDRLKTFNPPNVGIVGPVHHRWSTKFLEYDFAHKTHLEIFGFYYPRLLTDWFADEWITNVYASKQRLAFARDVHIEHTKSNGIRYDIHYENKQIMWRLLPHGTNLITRYIRDVMSVTVKQYDREVKVIAMSLAGKDKRDTFGAIRNCQIRRYYFPEWTLRFYIENPKYLSAKTVPIRIINKLKQLGAEIVYVHHPLNKLSVVLWPLLVVDDFLVHRFIVRRPRSRLSELDAYIVQEWTQTSNVIHCIRDHVSHAQTPIVDHLWGGKTKNIREAFTISMATILLQNTHMSSSKILTKIIWSKFENVSVCYESMSNSSFTNTKPLPTYKTKAFYLGESVDPYGEPVILNNSIYIETPAANSNDSVTTALIYLIIIFLILSLMIGLYCYCCNSCNHYNSICNKMSL